MRLDRLLVERGLVASRELGRRMIMAGEVLVNDQPSTKPGHAVPVDSRIRIKARPRFVSRGGEKLAAALEAFLLDPAGWVCADVGASTGGFTDCLLQAGAEKVYAIDVGYGQLAWKLRQDERVISMERTNARHLEGLPEQVDFCCIDASFISLGLLLPVLTGWLFPHGQIVALVKPQFEAGRSDVGKGGVVRDPDVHRRVLEATIEQCLSIDLIPRGLIASPVIGPKGNVEFLLWLALQPPSDSPAVADLVEAALQQVPTT